MKKQHVKKLKMQNMKIFNKSINFLYKNSDLNLSEKLIIYKTI